LVGAVAPDAGEAVGLQLEPYRNRVGGAGILPFKAPRLRVDPKQMLNVMPKLVSEDVRFREIAGRAEAPLQLVVEAEIDINLLIERTVERTHRRLGRSTPGLGHVTEEHELRILVGYAPIVENRAPRVLD